jgi:hypothetical protein
VLDFVAPTVAGLRFENHAAFPKPGLPLVRAVSRRMLAAHSDRSMNTRKTVEVVLLAALVAATAVTIRQSVAAPLPSVSAKLPRQEKLVQTITRQAQESNLPFVLVSLPVTVLLLLMQD